MIDHGADGQRIANPPERVSRLPDELVDGEITAPDLMVEVKSLTDSLPKLRSKIQEFLALGAEVGILIDPETHQLEVCRPHQTKPEYLEGGDMLTLLELLPGWAIAIAALWPLVF